MKEKSNLVVNKVEWLRSLEFGESKVGKFATPTECYNMSVIICKWNKTEALDKGFLIRAHYKTHKCEVEIYTESLAVYG